MKSLTINWITEGLIDFEYKKYVLLGYLKDIAGRFRKQKLYPHLSELINHYANLQVLKNSRDKAFNSFPKDLKRLDFNTGNIEYQAKISDQDDIMKEIDSIIEYSIPRIKYQLEEGKVIYDIIENNITIEPIGIKPINLGFGYIFLQRDGDMVTQVYEYEMSIFENNSEKYRGIKTNFLTSYQKSFSNTLENIKIDLVKNYKKLPNPATFLIHSKLAIPVNETLLPIAKRTFVRYLSEAA